MLSCFWMERAEMRGHHHCNVKMKHRYVEVEDALCFLSDGNSVQLSLL